MEEIIVRSQSELDELPIDYGGRIIIKFGTPFNRAVVNRKFRYSVEARENSSVVARGNSSVEARGNAQVVDSSRSHNITTNGNARIVHNPKNINEYIDHYNIQHSNGKAKLYKAVHKKGCVFVSDMESDFEYIIGQTATADHLDVDNEIDCGHGIHIAYKEWAVDFGRNWEDLAILEVEADIDSIVVPTNGSGKVRTDKVLVLREVPLEECGLLGKIIAKKQKKSGA